MIDEKIAFVILTWNGQDYLQACLDSVFALEAQDLAVYVVDNGSIDSTVEILEKYQAQEGNRLEVIYLDKNLGTTKTRNLALKRIPVDTSWLCILDSDTVINQKAIEDLIHALKEDQNALLSSPRMWRPDNVEQLSCKRFPTLSGKIYKGLPVAYFQKKGLKREGYDFFPDPNTTGVPPLSQSTLICPVDYAISACWLLRRQALEVVGFLDENYFYAPEDVDYCASIWETGYKVLFVSSAAIYHNTQRISHRKIFSRMNQEHIKGLLYYYRKHRKKMAIIRNNQKMLT